jgi:ACR3 family arsenite transporter
MPDQKNIKRLNIFEKYLTVWVALCIAGGILLGRFFPQVAVTLDSYSVYEISIPIAIALFFMMYPIMVKIDFGEVLRAAQTPKPVLLTLLINWAIKPFTMFLIAYFFLGFLFVDFIPGTVMFQDVFCLGLHHAQRWS